MLHTRLVNALTKAGAKVTADEYRNDHFFATLNDKKIDWFTQDGFDKKTKQFTKEKLEVSVCTARSPHTDVQTDCFCDSYAHTIKEALYFLGVKN